MATTERSGAEADLLARLASIADRGTLRITTRGRKSGQPHTVTIWFLVDGTTVYLGTLDARRDWVRNAEKTPAVELDIDGLRLRGRMSTITDPELEAHVRGLLASKYWMAWLGSWFGMGPARTFRVDGVEVA
jgi:F420H(2)-dependent quinone reductase